MTEQGFWGQQAQAALLLYLPYCFVLYHVSDQHHNLNTFSMALFKEPPSSGLSFLELSFTPWVCFYG